MDTGVAHLPGKHLQAGTKYRKRILQGSCTAPSRDQGAAPPVALVRGSPGRTALYTQVGCGKTATVSASATAL